MRLEDQAHGHQPLIRNLLDLSGADALRLSHPHNVLYFIDPASKHCTELRA